MKLYKNIVLTSFLLLPMAGQASGIGLYVPMAASTSISREDVDTGDTNDLDYEASMGIGFVYDTNVGMDEMYGYRFGLEYLNMGIDKINGYSYIGDETYTRYNMVNTFEFALVTSKHIRFWIGPRLNIAYETFEEGAYTENAFEFGIAPALGTNINLGSVVSLGLDVDYRFAAVGGTWDSSFGDGSFTGTGTGLTARFYLLFRFGESRSDAVSSTNNSNTNTTPSHQNDNVIDDSL